MTQLLDHSDVFGTGPSDTACSGDGLFALRTRRHRPEERMARRLLARLDEVADAVDETLASNSGYYAHLASAIRAFASDVTTSGVSSHPAVPTVVPPAATRRALQALDMLTTSLLISETEAAAVAGISRNTVRGWREGRVPYPATTRRLFRLANVFEAIERSNTRVADWIEQASPTGPPRRELLLADDGPAMLARDAATLLFGAPPVRTLASDLPAEDDVEAWSAESELEEDRFAFRSTRRRRSGH